MTTSYPIILAHGICPFDRIINPFFLWDNKNNDRFHYFRKIRSTLRSHGFTAFHSRVSWASELETRASDLKDQLNLITDNFTKWRRVHIIAHSMGGLDSRWMIYRYQMQDHVASLTTIGTPHLGTSFADWGLKRFEWLIQTAGCVGLNIQGLRDLTRESCKERNRLTNDFEEKNGVLYQTIAGVQPLERTFYLMRPSFKIIWKEEGENDGLVSLASAMWKKDYFIRQINADHLNQIGWWDMGEGKAGIDRESFEKGIREIYLDIARGLRD